MEERLAFIMKAKNLSMTRFADEIEVQRSSMSHVMNGRNKASLDFIRRILKRFPDINPDWLLFGKGSMSRQDVQMELDTGNESAEKLEDLKNESEEKSRKITALENELRLLKEAQRNQVKQVADNKSVQEEDAAIYGAQRRDIEYIVTFYSDKTFREYKPEK